MPNGNGILQKYAEKIKNDPIKRRGVLIAGIGLMGILSLFSFFPEKKTETQIPQADSSLTAEAYEKRLEEKLKKALSSIKGIGKVEVTLTLKSSEEIVYETDTKQKWDETVTEETRREYQEELQREIVFAEGEDGKAPLTRSVLPPTVQGVVVVCEGAGDINVEKAVIDAVTALFPLNTTQVAVVESAKNQ